MTDAASDAHRRRRRPADLRRMLILAGRELFAEQGYQATTQKQIASSAGVSTSVLFRNFGSKAQLLLEAVIEPFGEFVGGLDAVHGAAARPDPRPPHDFVVDLIGRLRPHRDTLRSLLTALHTPDGDALMAETGARFDQLVSRLATGAALGDGDVELDIRVIVGLVTTMVVLDDWILPAGVTVEDERVVGVVASMVSLDPHRPRRTPPGQIRTRALQAESEGASHPPDQRRNSDEVRAALLAAASRLFIEFGYSGTGYREIAVAAGTSESVLYRHFGSKDDLLAEAVLRPFTDSFEAASRDWARIDAETRRARQTSVIAELYGMFVENRHLVRVLMGLAHDPRHQELNQTIADWFARTFTMLGGLSQERARAEGITPYEPELRIRAVVAMVMAAAALDDWFLTHDGTALPPVQVVGTMSSLVDLGRSDRT